MLVKKKVKYDILQQKYWGPKYSSKYVYITYVRIFI